MSIKTAPAENVSIWYTNFTYRPDGGRVLATHSQPQTSFGTDVALQP